MKTKTFTLSFLFMLSIFFSGIASAQGDWVLKWSDEFNYWGQPNSGKWTFDHGPNWYNGELQYYTNNRSANCRVNGSALIIEAKEESYGGKSFTSARIKTKASWTYGKFEIRAKLTDGEALWPAIWMLPDNDTYGGWPASGEIDIMENWSWAPNRIFGTIHTTAFNHVNGTQKDGHKDVSDPSYNWHTYSITWGPDRIDWFVDGNWFFGFTNEGYSGAWPFDHNFHILLNLAVESTAWGKTGTWDKRTMEVDYVRAYQWEDNGSGSGGGSGSTSIKIEAEDYAQMSGIQTQACSEGTDNVGWINTNDWMTYNVNIPSSGTYTVEYRIASPNSTGKLQLEKGGGATSYGSLNVPNTGGWQNWQTISQTVNLSAGQQTLAIKALGNSWNINWFRISSSSTKSASASDEDFNKTVLVYPNPASDIINFNGFKPNEVQIYDATGALVQHHKVLNSNSISISELNDGIYFVRFVADSEIKTIRLLKH